MGDTMLKVGKNDRLVYLAYTTKDKERETPVVDYAENFNDFRRDAAICFEYGRRFMTLFVVPDHLVKQTLELCLNFTNREMSFNSLGHNIEYLIKHMPKCRLN